MRLTQVITFLALLILFNTSKGFTQNIPVIRSTATKVDIRLGTELDQGNWNIAPAIRPDVFDAYVPAEGLPLTFITNVDSIRFHVKPGDYHVFTVLLNNKDSALTAIRGILDVPRAHFPEAYKQSHQGKTFVEIPKVYELFKVILAISYEGKNRDGLVSKETPYYSEVLKWFEPFAREAAVKAINSDIANPDNYHALKMDAYAFDFQDQKIVRSAVYDRIGFSNSNNLLNHIGAMQEFSYKSRFLDFYSQHQNYYEGLIATYRDSIGVPQMQKWLNVNFPSTRYDAFKIIFSPLVSNNQSAIWFDFDGFREAQAHINFPFPSSRNPQALSKQATLVRAGNIVFTELNHAFINPESEKPGYMPRINAAFSNLTIWTDSEKPAKHYNSAYSAFNEYMNWALVSLRYVDFAPIKDQQKLISDTETMMVQARGFRKFAAFNQFLVARYRNRKKGEIVADLYPDIISWFETNNK
jgi:hypothetical protein